MVRGLEPRNTPKPADKSKSADGGIETAKLEVIKVLNELHELESHKQRRTGESGFDYSRILRSVQERLPQVTNVAGLYSTLFQEGISPGVMERMSEKLNLRLPNQGLESYIKNRFFGPDVVSEIDVNFKEEAGGQEWLRGFVAEQLSHRNLDLGTAHRVQELAHGASRVYGSSAESITRLMFMCSSDELEGGGSARHPDPVAQLERVITARQKEGQARDVSTERNFFTQMKRFFCVYADITAEVIRSAARPEVKTAVDKASKRAFSHFLRSEEFQSARWDQEKSTPDPFDVFRQMLLKEKDTNPWLVDDCRHTPFDTAKFGLLMSEDVPRGLVSEAARFLNNYRASLCAEKTNELLKSIGMSKKNPDGTLPEGLAKKVQNAVAEVRAFNQQEQPGSEDDHSRIEELSSFVSNNLVYSSDTGGIHPFTVLLRTVDAKRIVTRDSFRQEFNSFLSYIPSIQEIKGEGVEGVDADAAKKIAIIASSVKEFLDTKDPYMDIPLLALEDQSIRMLLTARSQQSWFDEAVLQEGPYAYVEDRKAHKEGPLLQPRDLSDMSKEQIQNLKKNFDTAKGVDTNSKREWISRACAIWNDIPNSYNTIAKFALRQAERFYSTQGKYGLVFYPSATSAMNDVVSRLFPRIVREDYILISNQEYDGMTDAFTNHGAGVEAIYCNDRKEKRAKGIDVIFTEMMERIEARKRLPAAVLLSSKTRFGDALGVAETKKEPNIYGLGELIKKFKERCPGIPVIVDGCQSVGRNDSGENNLERLGCDIYVNSGAKALGVENVAMLAIRKSPDDIKTQDESSREYIDEELLDHVEGGVDGIPSHWLSHVVNSDILKDPIIKLSPGKSTVDIRRVAALGIAFQVLNSRADSWKSDVNEKPQTLRERVANRMQELTRYAIAKTTEYPEILLTKPDFPFSAQITSSVFEEPTIRKQFGCQVVYPVHRKGADYNGILTVTFPNLGIVRHRGGPKDALVRDEYIKTTLQREGYLVEQCLPGQNAVRISFHYLHEEKDIDDLFEAIANAHVAFLRREMEKNKSIDSFARVVQLTPNTPDTWMEN